jgi:hypothetical protein
MCGPDCDLVLEWLLDHGLDPNLPADSGSNRSGLDVLFTPMDAAVIDQSDPWILQMLSAHGGKVTEQALFLTISRSGVARESIVHWLLDHGADPNASVRPWGRILRHAIKRGSWTLVEALIKHGAKVLVTTFDNLKVLNDLQAAEEKTHSPQIFKALKEYADASVENTFQVTV